jgi:uncharacterized membrane protein
MTTNSPISTLLEKQTKPKKPEMAFKWLMYLLTMFAVSLLLLYFINFHGGWGDKGDFGSFGDYFGGILNPIFGFATVGLLIWSLRLQMNELALSRQELSLTRQELAETKQETALSRKAMEEQVAHIQKEAKLNELMRLMTDLRTQYQTAINQKAKHYSDDLDRQISLYYSGIGEVTVGHLIYSDKTYSAQEVEQIRIELKNVYDYYASRNKPSQFTDLEEILCLFTTVVSRYSLSSSHSDLSAMYLNEARQMIQPFQAVFWSETINTQLKKINTFSQLAKKSNTTA